MGRFKYLFFVAICIGLFGIWHKALASFTPSDDNRSDVLANTNATPENQNGVAAATPGPLILYTDITSGPNSGGEGNGGIYLTIFGLHFGATQGTSTVTINGRPVAQYILWSDTKIGVQIGRAHV